MKVYVKHAANDVVIDDIDAASLTVGMLKERLEAAADVFARHQKLIFKGKVLDDKATLSACKITDGSKLMLLVSPSAGKPPQPVRQTQAPAAHRSSSPKAVGGSCDGKAGGSQGSSSIGLSNSTARALTLPERRQSWSKMGVVALRDLALDSVPPECFEGLPDVRAADLSQNRLAAVPASLSRLCSLSSLRLSDNAVTDEGMAWGALAALTGLSQLSLDGNALTRLPAALSYCSALVRLGVAGNRLVEVEPGALEGLSLLQELDLSNNALASLPDTIGACTSLVDISAADNQLTAIPAAITRLTKLRSLQLDNNRIKSLPDHMFGACASLAALLLRGNPITVDALRGAPHYAQYEARRRARTDKQLGGRVMADIERAFCEGADVKQWQHYK